LGEKSPTTLQENPLTSQMRLPCPDTDHDGLPDGFEVQYRLDPLHRHDVHQDPDGDGLDNREEHVRGTQPDNPDTDGDGLSDGAEVKVHISSPTQVDSDRDDLPDSIEINVYGTNPFEADTDFDNLSDSEEVYVFKTDPRNPDTDGDIFHDDEELFTGADRCSHVLGQTTVTT
jgi:Bacterial TSP3 repeat/Clostridial binary toxin B/anthrax toxin PA Ca-binding domain